MYVEKYLYIFQTEYVPSHIYVYVLKLLDRAHCLADYKNVLKLFHYFVT